MTNHILIVEDEQTLREILTYNLERQGYEVTAIANGLEALTFAQETPPDLILLDVMLPGLDGMEVCRRLRRESNMPILMLTARTDEIDRVVGLEMGADDYISKPFSVRELLARVKANLRRVQLNRDENKGGEKGKLPKVGELSRTTSAANNSLLVFNNLEIDQKRREIRLDGKPLQIKPKEFELLLFLARHQGMALSRDVILERVWDWAYAGTSRTVDVHIRWLREKIEADPSNAKRIVTVRGIGYRFEG